MKNVKTYCLSYTFTKLCSRSVLFSPVFVVFGQCDKQMIQQYMRQWKTLFNFWSEN